MKIAVVGAGVVGLATAHELFCAGHGVTLLERRGTAAEEGSFAPAGLLHPAWALAWSGPPPSLQLPWTSPGAGVRWRAGLDLQAWRWWWRWRNAGRRRDPQAEAALQDLLTIGQDRLQGLTTELDLDHDRSDGALVLLRDDREKARAQPLVDHLREAGLTLRLVASDEARVIEPALNPDQPLAAAVHLQGPAVANCREWALIIRQRLLQSGSRVLARASVQSLTASGGGISIGLSDGSDEWFDAAVLCNGIDAPALMAPLGLAAPFQVTWSHSLSAPVREPMDAPASAVIDPIRRVLLTRLGQRVRSSGTIDLGGDSGKPDAACVRHLAQAMSDWFPAAARLGGTQAALQTWRGAMLNAPDGLPVVGASRVAGLWLNIAHGPIGWASACGSARRLADALSGASTTRSDGHLAPARLGL